METKKILIAVGGVVAVLVAFFLNFWFTRPIYKFNKAVEKEDMAKAAELLDQVGPDNYVGASNKVLIWMGSVSSSYISESISYDEAINQLSLFDNTSMVYDERLQAVKDGLAKQKKSKEAWINGKSAYDSKDYYTAFEELKDVIYTDANYDTAQGYIKECNDEILKSFVGTWYCDIDLGKGELRAAKLDQYGEDVPLPTTFKMDFGDDGKMLMSLESENFAEDFERFLENLINVSVKAIAVENGISEKEVSYGIELALGKSLHDYIFDTFDCEKFERAVESASTEYTYSYEDGQLLLNDNGTITKCELEGNDILLDDLPSRTKNQLKKLNIEVPLRFIREDRQSSGEQDANGAEEAVQ